jgi:hypothetical protein
MAYSKIRIIKTPPGFAPEEIGNQWVGIEIPLATDSEIEANPPSGLGIGNSHMGGFQVLVEEAIAALVEAHKFQAATYWSSVVPAGYLVFRQECCLLLN